VIWRVSGIRGARRSNLKNSHLAGTLIGLALVATGQPNGRGKYRDERHHPAKPSHHSRLVESLERLPPIGE